MNKPPIKNYVEKAEYLYKYQGGLCSACNMPMKVKPDIAHWLSRTDDNIVKYPLYIDSILNISLQHNICNVGRLVPRGKEPQTDLMAGKIEKYLQQNPDVSEYVNNPCGTNFTLSEVLEDINEL